MLSTKQLTSVSKFIGLVLRHKPEAIGLRLDANGSADTTELINKMNSHGKAITFFYPWIKKGQNKPVFFWFQSSRLFQLLIKKTFYNRV